MPGVTESVPDGINHYNHADEVPLEIKKYWHQRYLLFSKYDENIWMTNDAWFGVTPEPVANKIAEHIAKAAPREKRILVDAFAGVGGNTIAFALSGRWDRIFAIEKDPKVLQCGKHNSQVYGVYPKIWWILGDFKDILRKNLASIGSEAVIFGSPPWGGPTYRGDEVFNLASMQPYNLRAIYEPFYRLTKDIVLYLPRTSDLNELAAYVPEDCKIAVTHYCLSGFSKAICAYFGSFKWG